MLKAVLFDLDDTLIDWSGFSVDWDERERELITNVFEWVNQGPGALDDLDQLVLTFRERTRDAWEIGRNNLRAPHLGRVLVETLVEVGIAPEHIDERLCLEAYGWGAAPGVVTFPDVPPALELLIQHDIAIGIVTNAHQPMWIRDRELAEFGLLDYFPDCRISAADAGYLKPHPHIFEQALERLGVTAAETVFVGDNPVADISGAQGVGIKAVLRIRQPVSPMLNGLITPDRAIHSLEELPPILDEWHPGWRS